MYSWNIYVSISKLTSKTKYIKHAIRNITFSKAAEQDNIITGQTTSQYVLYLNVHLFATIVSIQSIILEVGGWGWGCISTCRNGMRLKFVPEISLVQ